MKLADNSKSTAKKKPRGKPFQKGGDDRINIKGAPPRGSSMAEAYSWAMALSPNIVADILEINGKNDLSRQFRQMPQGIQLKLLVALRIVAAIMFEPQSGLVNHVVDHIDGPIKIPIETWQDRVIELLRENKVTPEQVEDEFGADVATDLAIAAGLQLSEGSKTGTASGAQPDADRLAG